MGWMAREKQMSEMANATSKMWVDLRLKQHCQHQHQVRSCRRPLTAGRFQPSPTTTTQECCCCISFKKKCLVVLVKLFSSRTFSNDCNVIFCTWKKNIDKKYSDLLLCCWPLSVHCSETALEEKRKKNIRINKSGKRMENKGVGITSKSIRETNFDWMNCDQNLSKQSNLIFPPPPCSEFLKLYS